jgi:hypothetical protein
MSTISEPDELNNECLQERSKRAKSGWATEYIVRVESPEAALPTYVP